MKTGRDVISNTIQHPGYCQAQGKQVRLAHPPTLGSSTATVWDQILSLKEYWSDLGHSCS